LDVTRSIEEFCHLANVPTLKSALTYYPSRSNQLLVKSMTIAGNNREASMREYRWGPQFCMRDRSSAHPMNLLSI
jgi:hypothetical protein